VILRHTERAEKEIGLSLDLVLSRASELNAWEI
jgi:hypothetical protein